MSIHSAHTKVSVVAGYCTNDTWFHGPAEVIGDDEVVLIAAEDAAKDHVDENPGHLIRMTLRHEELWTVRT